MNAAAILALVSELTPPAVALLRQLRLIYKQTKDEFPEVWAKVRNEFVDNEDDWKALMGESADDPPTPVGEPTE